MPSIDSSLYQQGYGRGGEPGPSIGESFGPYSGAIGPVATDLLDTIAPGRTTTKIDRNSTTVLSPQAIDQFIYSALSGNSGISAIRSAEAGSGGYGSSSSALQSADLIAAVAGQIGEITGPKIQQSESTTKKKKSIICTALYELGDIPADLYVDGQEEFQNLPLPVIYGYHSWGYTIADLVPRYWLVRKIAKFIAVRRYEYILRGQWNFTGWLTVIAGEPICGMIGQYILRRRYGY